MVFFYIIQTPTLVLFHVMANTENHEANPNHRMIIRMIIRSNNQAIFGQSLIRMIFQSNDHSNE